MTGSSHTPPSSDRVESDDSPRNWSHEDEDASPRLVNEVDEERDGRGWPYISPAPKRARDGDYPSQWQALDDTESSPDTLNHSEYASKHPFLVS